MEFINEVTPPLPPKNQNLISESKMMNLGSVCKEAVAYPKNVEINSTEISAGGHDKNSFFVPQTFFLQSSEISQAHRSSPNLKCWADNKPMLRSKQNYENIYFGVNNNTKHGAKNEKLFFNEKDGARKTPEIEVRQEDNKTVVKISIKDVPPQVQNLEDTAFSRNIYENGYVGTNGFTFPTKSEVCGIENNENSSQITLRQLYENLPETNCQETVSDECLYENLGEAIIYFEGKPITKANHGKVNEGDLKCDQVYENDFEFTKNKTRKIKNSVEHEEKGDDSYEAIESNRFSQYDDNSFGNGEKSVTVERRKSDKADAVKKSSFADMKLSKSNYIIDYNCSGDPIDSGACSDVESLHFANNTKKGIIGLTAKNLHCDDVKKNDPGHKRAESLTSSGVGIDSEESDGENSNISCDSLNSSDPYLQSNSEDNGYHTPNSEDKTDSPVEVVNYENMIKNPREESKKETTINRNIAKENETIKDQPTDAEKYFCISDFQDYENVNIFVQQPVADLKNSTFPPPPPPPPSNTDKSEKNCTSNISSESVRLSSTYPNGEIHHEKNTKVTRAVFSFNEKSSAKRGLVEEKTYEERQNNVKSVKVNNICAMEVDTDMFYKFHLAEKFPDRNENEEETFAGVKDYLSREKPAAITSAKGTIRGVKNRVKAGIATFLQMHENKSYKDRDAGKVVVYTTTMGIVRETYHKCLKVKQILKTLMVKFEERDVFMSAEAQQEIRDRMKCNIILVPQVFVEGQHIGDAETIERLNEIGELRIILKPYKSADASSTCNVCGGYRLLPCKICKGSKKSIHRNHFTMEFVSLKCMNCDQVGLTKCNAC